MGIGSSNEPKEEEEHRLPPRHIFSPAEVSILDQSDEDEDGWTQDIPDFDALLDSPKSSRAKNKFPLELPAHLERALLNSQPIADDPGMLPLPHHVMLNHIYARPSSHQTVILGLTIRYKENFVTVVYYKPVKKTMQKDIFDDEPVERRKRNVSKTKSVPIPTLSSSGD